MQSYFASEVHIRQLRWAVYEGNLSAPDAFWDCSESELREVYNGIGPDRWSDRFRRFTTLLLARFEPEALIHDWEYTFQPKNYRHFTLANLRFAYNAARYAIHARKGVRYALRGAVLALLCQLFGWRGFKKEQG